MHRLTKLKISFWQKKDTVHDFNKNYSDDVKISLLKVKLGKDYLGLQDMK